MTFSKSLISGKLIIFFAAVPNNFPIKTVSMSKIVYESHEKLNSHSVLTKTVVKSLY